MNFPQRPYDINQDLINLDDVSSIFINIHNAANTDGQELITLNPNFVTDQENHPNTIAIIENIDVPNDLTIITETTKELLDDTNQINTISVINHLATQETLTATTETVTSLSEEVRQKRPKNSRISTWSIIINKKTEVK